MVKVDLFLKKPGKVFKLHDAKFRELMIGKEEGTYVVNLVLLNDKLLYERSSVVKFMSSRSLSSCNDPSNLLFERSRTETELSWKNDVGKVPDR
ncbi:hypothetical protein P8452_35139 [Trifolium repens]|jgi:hypothetical protein|nr:hypothetical protein P8452_35139 [Trifolium repens]